MSEHGTSGKRVRVLVTGGDPFTRRSLERTLHGAGYDCVASDNGEAVRVTLAQQSSSLAGKTLAEIERQAILDTLRACGGNKAATARALGVCEKTIYNKLKRLGRSGVGC